MGAAFNKVAPFLYKRKQSMDKYSIILQHTVNKKCWTFHTVDVTPESDYYCFDVQLIEEMPTGEYQYVLISNPEERTVIPDSGDLRKSKLISGKTVVLQIGLLRIVPDDTPIEAYEESKEYIAYE